MTGLNFLRFFFLAPVLLLAGCFGEENAAPEHFSQPSYAYLTPLYVKVADIETVDRAKPAPGSLAAQMPYPLDQSAIIMAQDRLQPRGGAGLGTLTVLSSDVSKSGRIYTGSLKIKLTLQNPDMGGSSTVTAFVEDNYTATSSMTSKRALYNLGSKIMNDMNVELEYQLRNKLGRWLTTASGESPSGRDVESQALPPV